MVVGGYQLDLYCEVCNNTGDYSDDSKSMCFKLARLDGWSFSQKRTKCFCKLHRKSDDKEATNECR